MDTRTISRRRLVPAVLAGALLLVPVAGCGDTAGTEAAPEVTATESAPAGETTEPETSQPEASEPGITGATGTAGGTNADVNCTGTSCTVTLAGDGAQADILGTPIELGAVESGRASIRVGGQEIGCSQGQSVPAGPLSIECTTVTQDSVTMTASLG